MIITILVVLALASFIFATFGYPAPINLTALGLSLLTIAYLVVNHTLSRS